MLSMYLKSTMIWRSRADVFAEALGYRGCMRAEIRSRKAITTMTLVHIEFSTPRLGR